MCGILGGWLTHPPLNYKDKISQAITSLKNRGPNDQKYDTIHLESLGQVFMGHTRLSIIDLSSSGHQPMYSDDGRYAIIFNGEIYNYKELRQTLIQSGYVFRSGSDTEVLLKAWIHWGKACLQQLVGMFAFVIYDKYQQTLSCVRDAFGIKPFFYELMEGSFIFASTIQALIKLRAAPPQINIQRSYDYLVYGDYDSQEQSFIEGVKQLLPGQLLVFDLKKRTLSAPELWWQPTIAANTSQLSFSSAAEAVRHLFLSNIALHLRSDVPLGAALSGGVDSSAVVCAMRYIEPEMPIHTFSFISDNHYLSEEKWVDQVNQHVGAISHKVFPDEKDLARDLDEMIYAQGEPFGGTSIYAQYRIYKLAQDHGITVTLDGQGADELLAGYQGYPTQRISSLLEQKELLAAARFIRQWHQWPDRGVKKAFLHCVQAVLPDNLQHLSNHYQGIKPRPDWLNMQHLDAIQLKTSIGYYKKEERYKGKRVIERLRYSLQQKGLPELLRHGDRNSMHFSIESRVPFLTIPMADLLFSLPEHYLISHSGETKSVFREAMRDIVPDVILNRRDKIGFATPEKDWLFRMAPTIRTWLKDSNEIPLFNSTVLLNHFDSMIAGKKPFSQQIWRWINFVRWHQHVIQHS